MARKKVVLAYIKNDTNRKASLRKRRRGLINKVREINTLCDVDACVVIFSPHDPVPEVWPSPERTRDLITSHFAVPEIDRSDKELNPESFMRKRLRKTREKVERIHRENKRRDLNFLTYRCMARMDSLDHIDILHRGEMGRVINQVIWDIKYSMEHFVQKGAGNGQGASISATTAMAPPTLPPFVAPVTPPPPPPLVAPVAPPPAVVEEESRNTSMMSLLMSPIEELDWDLGELPYPSLFNEWDLEFKNNEN